MEKTVILQGNRFFYQDREILLDETTFLLDGLLKDAEIADNPYVFNNISDALNTINALQGAKGRTVTLYIAPYVYWIDDPDATDTLEKQEGMPVPFGFVVDCDCLKLIGLCKDPYEVIIAGNRGQSHGATGNYTMFLFRVRDLELKDLTVANYCSLDLVYPPNQALNHAKRTEVITQAQLGMQQGDKLLVRNCNFVSRLNLMPVNGGLRCLYQNCHFESTDDALNGNAVYVDCDFDFYGNRPIYDAQRTGDVFLNCRFRDYVRADCVETKLFFTKEGGPVTAVDCEYVGDRSSWDGVDWTKYPHPSLKCYQYNVNYHGEPVFIGGEGADETVVMDGKPVLEAYRFEKDGQVIYNIYNLLRGEDDWDPLQIKDLVCMEGKENIATFLTMESSACEIVSGQDVAELTAKAFYFHGGEAEAKISFAVKEADADYVRLIPGENGTCQVEGTNKEDLARDVKILAKTAEGLEAATLLKVYPKPLEAPRFLEGPELKEMSGILSLEYKLDLAGYEDCSEISWYRCEDGQGSNAVLVAVSREGKPLQDYFMNAGDTGYYLMAVMRPCHVRSNPGEEVRMISKWPAPAPFAGDIQEAQLITEFIELPNVAQRKVLPGFWTVDFHEPMDKAMMSNWVGEDTEEPWKYGSTGNGSIGTGFYQNVQGARLMYTPVGEGYGDMTLKLYVDPAKTAGQGFGSAGQYMDVCIKFDTTTLTGYGFRVIRTKEAADGVTMQLVKYVNGKITVINEGMVASCYRTGCEILLEAKGNQLTVHVESQTANKLPPSSIKYALTVDLTAEIEANPYGGIAIQHAGTPGIGGWQNTTMLHRLEVDWF